MEQPIIRVQKNAETTTNKMRIPQQVIDKFGELLNIKPGETTDDGLFTLDALRCIGACGIAPAISINGKVYPKVAVNQVASIIEEYRQLGGAE